MDPSAFRPARPMPLFGASLLLLFCACGGGEGTGPVFTDPDMNRQTPSNLVGKYLPAAITSMDSARVEWSLGEEFGLYGEVAGKREGPVLTREALLDSVGRLFHGRPDQEGRTVEQVSLIIDLKGTFLDQTGYPGQPEGEEWFKSVIYFDLLLVYTGTDGRENRLLQAEMNLVTRPDTTDPELWVVHRAELEPSP